MTYQITKDQDRFNLKIVSFDGKLLKSFEKTYASYRTAEGAALRFISRTQW